MNIRSSLTTLCWLLPPCRAKNAALRRLGHDVHPTARLGICLVRNVASIRVGPSTSVGSGNIVRGLREFTLGQDVIVGQLNWFSVAPSLSGTGSLAGRLILDDHAVLTNRHYVDCSGGVRLDRFATLGGVRCTVLSHSVDLNSARQTTVPVTLAEQAFVSTNCTVMAGTTMAVRAVLAAGSVTALGGRYETNTLYGGVPARPIREIDGAYFHRTRAWIGE